MAKLTVDFSDAESFDAVPAGEYPVVVIEVEVRESQRSEHPYLNWELEITEGEATGRKLWMMTSLSPKALWRLQQVFENLGLPQDEVELEVDDDTGLVTEPELAGLPAVAPVTNEVYEGRERARVETLLAYEDPATQKKGTAKGKSSAKGETKSGGRKRTFR